jgi:hypothetical protein
MSYSRFVGLLATTLALSACSSDNNTATSGAAGAGSGGSGATGGGISSTPVDPDKAEKVGIDRFSDAAGHLQKRSAAPSLPGPNAPVDFDQGPFITQGFGPHGEVVKYYNFDVQPKVAAPIYVLMTGGKPVDTQLNIVDVIPGDDGYNDFWQVITVDVPDSYVANTITSATAVASSGFAKNSTDMLVNCPIVPDGSTATLRDSGDSSPTDLVHGWYKGKVVTYFTFGEKQGGLAAAQGMIPTSPIYVTFNDDKMGPASGFKMETGSMQTHNVIATLPTDTGYSPLWAVAPYPNAKFDAVMDLATALSAPPGDVAADVNCPVVSIVPKN